LLVVGAVVITGFDFSSLSSADDCFAAAVVVVSVFCYAKKIIKEKKLIGMVHRVCKYYFEREKKKIA
jgi:hypothetical protein